MQNICNRSLFKTNSHIYIYVNIYNTSNMISTWHVICLCLHLPLYVQYIQAFIVLSCFLCSNMIPLWYQVCVPQTSCAWYWRILQLLSVKRWHSISCTKCSQIVLLWLFLQQMTCYFALPVSEFSFNIIVEAHPYFVSLHCRFIVANIYTKSILLVVF